nr:MAG TPA: hypothetical protein [Caudoviricetes sp.]
MIEARIHWILNSIENWILRLPDTRNHKSEFLSFYT